MLNEPDSAGEKINWLLMIHICVDSSRHPSKQWAVSLIELSYVVFYFTQEIEIFKYELKQEFH